MVPSRARLLEDVSTRYEIALRVAGDLIGVPLGMRFTTDHDEERGRGNLFDDVAPTIRKGEVFDTTIATTIDDFGAVADDDLLAKTAPG